jgi:hypothetical protein
MATKKTLSDLISATALATILENGEAAANAYDAQQNAATEVKTTRMVTTCDFIFVYNQAGTTGNHVWAMIETALIDHGVDVKSDGQHDLVAWVRRLRPVAKKLAKKYKAELDAKSCNNPQDVIDFMTEKGFTSFSKMERATKEDARKLTADELEAAEVMTKTLTDLLGTEETAESILASCSQIVRTHADKVAANASDEVEDGAELPAVDLGNQSDANTGTNG